jgi:thiamine biosynthesis lipoprotein
MRTSDKPATAPGGIAIEARPGGVYAARFLAMGCPCEILVAHSDARSAALHAQPGIDEARRIERKFSRYRADSVVTAVNASDGRPVAIDDETQRLLDYAAHCHVLSEGRFDITCGVLRRAWDFDGSDRVPAPEQVEALLERIGFWRLQRTPGHLTVPSGMEIDLGGIAKEYAVDRALEAVESTRRLGTEADEVPAVLVNFGGDLRANAPPGAQSWQVGVESVARESAPALVLELARGALATSGDTHRFVLRDGVRYGHILDPRSGWPIRDAPRSVTVAASTCVEAGTLSTIALLHGAGAEAFLDDVGVRYWCLR